MEGNTQGHTGPWDQHILPYVNSSNRAFKMHRYRLRPRQLINGLLFCLEICHGLIGAKSLQPCLTLYDSMDWGLPGSFVHGILQARILEWKKKKKNVGVGCHFLLQGIFRTQGSNPHLLHLLHWQAGSLPLPWTIHPGDLSTCASPHLPHGSPTPSCSPPALWAILTPLPHLWASSPDEISPHWVTRCSQLCARVLEPGYFLRPSPVLMSLCLGHTPPLWMALLGPQL